MLPLACLARRLWVQSIFIFFIHILSFLFSSSAQLIFSLNVYYISNKHYLLRICFKRCCSIHQFPIFLPSLGWIISLIIFSFYEIK